MLYRIELKVHFYFASNRHLKDLQSRFATGHALITEHTFLHIG